MKELTEDQKSLILKLIESVKIATQSMTPSNEDLTAIYTYIAKIATDATAEE